MTNQAAVAHDHVNHVEEARAVLICVAYNVNLVQQA